MHLGRWFSNFSHSSCAQIFFVALLTLHIEIYGAFPSTPCCVSHHILSARPPGNKKWMLENPVAVLLSKELRVWPKLCANLLRMSEEKWQEPAVIQWSNISLIIFKAFCLASTVSYLKCFSDWGQYLSNHLFLQISCQMRMLLVNVLKSLKKKNKLNICSWHQYRIF